MIERVGTGKRISVIVVVIGVLIAAFAYMSTKPLGDIPGVAVTTDARVCFNDDCEGNAEGIKYSANGITLVVLEGDNWIIPVEFGDGFSLRSADIQAPRP